MHDVVLLVEEELTAPDARRVVTLHEAVPEHVVAEFLHRDWTTRARRHLGVPVLHLAS